MQSAETIQSRRNCVVEIGFTSSTPHEDPYADVTLDVVFEAPDGSSLTVPAFWRGENQWAVRFSASQIGDHRYRSACSDTSDSGLHGVEGLVAVEPYTGTNPLFRNGRLRVAEDRSHLVHADDTPFFWLGDTWWMALTDRLAFPGDFEKLTADRVQKGFNVVQIVAGLYSEIGFQDPRGANEAGLPFAEDFARIRPAFFDHVDRKLQHLVESGLVPCVLGSWGYYLPKLGLEKTRQFWRYLVARYGAWPVVWCIAGEATMPWYLSESKPEDEQFQKTGWCEIASYVRELDPFGNLVSIHPAVEISTPGNARDFSEDVTPFDFEMLQTGHSGFDSLPTTTAEVSTAVARTPRMPVINAEVNYEGICGQCWQDVQRLSFYLSIFHGATGYTYGANGVWQVNQRGQSFGPSPHGANWGFPAWEDNGINWGNMPWDEAAALPGGTQVALGGRFISQFPWWELEAHPEWAGAQLNEAGWRKTLCVGIPRQLRIIYVPQLWTPPRIKELEPDIDYRACYFDPCTGTEHPLGSVHADEAGEWQPPFPPEMHDWIIVLQSRTG